MSDLREDITDNQIVWLQMVETMNDNFRKCKNMKDVQTMLNIHDTLIAEAAESIAKFNKK